MRQMRILHIIEGLQESCGISRFIVEIAREQQALGQDVAILTTRNWNVLADDLMIFQTYAPEVAAQEYSPDIVHVHGCWNKYVHRMASWCQRRQIPYCLSPHGAWTEWALRFHRWKKMLAWLFFQRRDARNAAAFHATVSSEVDDIRRLKLTQPVITAPLGMRVGIDGAGVPPIGARGKIMLYLGRLHHKKNVHGLLDVWRSIPSEQRAEWKLLIAGKPGPGDDCYLESLRKLADDSCCFVGEVIGREKEKMYQSARIFVLPSFSENFGAVVLEALANGTPVITTEGTPWKETIDYGCGWRCSPDAEALRGAMIRAMGTDVAELEAMSGNALDYVQKNFSWKKSAEVLISGYRALLSK